MSFEPEEGQVIKTNEEKIEEEKTLYRNEMDIKFSQITQLNSEIEELCRKIIEVPSENAINFMSQLIDVNQFKNRRGLICQILKILVSRKISDTMIKVDNHTITVEWNTPTKFRQFVYGIEELVGKIQNYPRLKYNSDEYRFSERFFGGPSPQYGLMKCFLGTNIKISNTAVGIHFDYTGPQSNHDYFFTLTLMKYREI